MNAEALSQNARETVAAVGDRLVAADWVGVSMVGLVTLLNLLVVWNGVSSRLLSPNDTRHWLLRARYYAGWQMPAADVPGQFATHPVAILTLAAVLLLVGSALLAAKLWTVLVYLFATSAVYVTVRELGSTRAALVAFATVSFAQYLYFDLLAWGGIPNLLAVGTTTLAVGALVRARRTGTVRDRLAYGLVLALALFSHPPSAPVVVAVLGGTGLTLALVRRDAAVVSDTFVDSVLPAAVFLGYLWTQWDIFSTYAASTRGQSIRVIWQMLSRHPWMLLLFVAGLGALSVLAVRTRPDDDATGLDGLGGGGDRRGALAEHERALVVLGWVVGPMAVALTVDLLPTVQTELSRVSYYLAAPLSAAVGLYLAHLGAGLASELRGWGVDVSIPGVSLRSVLTLLLVVGLVVPGWGFSDRFYTKAQAYYTYDNEASIYETTEWVESRQPFEGRVAGPYELIPWVKALTGQEGMTPTPRSGSYRPDEWREADAYRAITAVAGGDASQAELRAAAAVLHEYDVRYLVVYAEDEAAYERLGSVVYRTDAFVVVDLDPRIREGTWTPRSASSADGADTRQAGGRERGERQWVGPASGATGARPSDR